MPPVVNRRQLLQTAAALAAPTVLPAWAAPLPQLTLSGPPAIVSAPLIHMAQSNALAGVAAKTVFTPWRDPDQLRVMAIGNKADILAMPSNVAANLYNRGAGVQLLNIATWGALWVVTRDGQRQTLLDFKGEEIAVPFRGDMPDIMLQLLCAKQGINAQRDLQLRYVPSPMEAMQLLITRRVRHALLVEPGVSMALRKTKSFPVSVIAPELHRSVDLQQEWGRLFKQEARLPQAGITVLGKALNDPALQARVMAAYEKSVLWCQKNALQCGEMVARRIDLLTPEAVADSLAASPLQHVSAAAARDELTLFFQQMHAKNPALVGGKLPDAGFYGNPGQP